MHNFPPNRGEAGQKKKTLTPKMGREDPSFWVSQNISIRSTFCPLAAPEWMQAGDLSIRV